MMYNFLELCLCISSAFLLSTGCSESAQASKSDMPNILLIMCDDLGWGDVGFNGHPDIKTPNLDRLAAQGMVLNRFYAASAVCSPTRASVLTGRNPYRMGIPNANAGHMPPEEITLPELLHGKGYATGHFGKWHLGTLTTMIKDANRGRPGDSSHYAIPATNGYDSYFCTESKTPTWDPMHKPVVFEEEKGESLHYGWAAMENDSSKVAAYGTFYWTGPEQMELNNLSGDDSRVIMDRVIPFVEQAIREGKAFFSTIWFHTPHLPLVTGKKYRDLYPDKSHQEQLLYGSITAMDEQVGRLWKHLEALGEADNTMLWFCSDNGPERNTPGLSGPFRERKRSLYEGGVRVPAFVVWPQGIRAGQTTEVPMATLDYLPTILDYLNLSYPDPNRPLDGKSLRGIIEGNEDQRSKAIGFRFRQKISWVTEQYKLISTDEEQTFELYDLLADKSETKDIAQAFPELVDKLKADLMAWKTSCEESAKGGDY